MKTILTVMIATLFLSVGAFASGDTRPSPSPSSPTPSGDGKHTAAVPAHTIIVKDKKVNVPAKPASFTLY